MKLPATALVDLTAAAIDRVRQRLLALINRSLAGGYRGDSTG